ncbi:MAG TPA: radical SAM protein [Anaeromyxobacter sp.]
MKARPVELSLDEACAKHPDVPRLVVVKTDVQRRGVYYTDAALERLDPERHQTTGTHLFGVRDGLTTARPESLLLRDGSSIVTTPTPIEQGPYVVDFVDGRLALVDGGRPVEEVEYWPRPDFYGKTTRSGLPMRFVVSARPQRLNVFPYRHCHFWNDDEGCLFCDIVPQLRRGKDDHGVPARLDPEDVRETVAEALKEPGRFVGMCITAGSNTRGAAPFDDEVEYYVEILRAIGASFDAPRFPSQLIGTAFTEAQLERLHRETGLMAYTADVEVLDERLFGWICPGKARWIGYREWKRRLVAAAKIFGRGRVNTGIVAGVELAQPHGFTSEDGALQAVLSEAEGLAAEGVSTVFIVWSPRPASALGDQRNASLDYYLRLAKGLHGLRLKYRLPIEFDDYRHCGNHPDTDLSRLNGVLP